jgi:hypothetical protein
MKQYQVFLTRDYIVEINAKNKEEAKECVEFFVSGGLDASTIEERNHHNFEIMRINPVVNEAFEVNEIKN